MTDITEVKAYRVGGKVFGSLGEAKKAALKDKAYELIDWAYPPEDYDYPSLKAHQAGERVRRGSVVLDLEGKFPGLIAHMESVMEQGND